MSSKSSKMENSPFPPQTSCHQKYYINGGDLHVLISSVYFRVNSYFFSNPEGATFFENFVPAGSKVDPNALPGTGGPEKAIIIRNATVEEFCRFLWVFYNEKLDDYSEASLSDWFTILRLAHEWGFKNVKTFALRYIKKQEHEIPNVVDRLVAYEKYSPPVETLLPLYLELIKRDEYPTEAECLLLGDQRALQIHRAREKILRAMKKATGGRLDSAQVQAIVVETLGLASSTTAATTTSKVSPPSLSTSSSQSAKDSKGKDSDVDKPISQARKTENIKDTSYEPQSAFNFSKVLDLKPEYGTKKTKSKADPWP